MRLARILTVVATTAAALFAVTGTANAAPVNYVALGDSYASGVGTGRYDAASGSCKRGPLAYPALWAASHAVTSFAFVACGGARTGDVINGQVSALSAQTTMVTLQVGGNDAGFGDVVNACTFGSDQDCVNRTNQAKTYVQNTLPGLLSNVYSTVRSRAPYARVVVMGYPRLYQVPGTCIGGSDTKRTAMNAASTVLSQVIAERAAAASFTYVDLNSRFSGHQICSYDWWLNGLTWPTGESFHPNRAGHQYGYLPAMRSVLG